MPDYQLAQLNIGVILEPLAAPRMADFVNNLDPINALAEATPGFVWRLQTEEGNATALRLYDDETLVNMSVWENLESLRGYVYASDHAAYLRRRKEWFALLKEAYTVLWWVPRDHRPTLAEAAERLDALRADGPTPFAFTFGRAFPSPGAAE